MSNRVRHKIISFTGALSFAIALSSCGIDTLSYLSIEPVSYSEDESNIIFQRPSSVDADFNGIYIFYKIYAASASADIDKDIITAKQNATDSVPGSVVESYLISPSGLNYKRLVRGNSIPIPTLHKTILGPGEYASIEFFTSDEPLLNIIDTAYSFAIKRNELISGEYLSFLDLPLTGDDDYKSATSDPDEFYYAQFYAASYGLDGLTEVYSDAVWLGLITLNF